MTGTHMLTSKDTIPTFKGIEQGIQSCPLTGGFFYPYGGKDI